MLRGRDRLVYFNWVAVAEEWAVSIYEGPSHPVHAPNFVGSQHCHHRSLQEMLKELEEQYPFHEIISGSGTLKIRKGLDQK